MITENKNQTYGNNSEKELNTRLSSMLKNTTIPEDELLSNLGIFLTSKNLARILFFYEIYQHVYKNHGVVFDFGIRYGQTTSLFVALRSIFEPFNRHRKIVGFDTFSGLDGVSDIDGKGQDCGNGAYTVSKNYKDEIEEILAIQEKLNPLEHIKKYELVEGDVTKTLDLYLKEHPETIISLAFFDMDIYKPTKYALEKILPYTMKGTVLVFDEACDELFPGETVAIREVLGNNIELKRIPFASRLSYCII